jgi:hypothetical protein
MTKAETTAESFVTVLKALPKRERDAVLIRIVRDRDFARDIVDLTTIEQRRLEPSRPFRDRLAKRKAG